MHLRDGGTRPEIGRQVFIHKQRDLSEAQRICLKPLQGGDAVPRGTSAIKLVMSATRQYRGIKLIYLSFRCQVLSGRTRPQKSSICIFTECPTHHPALLEKDPRFSDLLGERKAYDRTSFGGRPNFQPKKRFIG